VKNLKVRRDKIRKNFSEWFDNVLSENQLYDWRYPLKGCGVWLPYGFKIRKFVLEELRRLHDETGHEETLFPLLIPEDLLKLESHHIKGFEKQVYWVTHGGTTELDVKLVLRPTSETGMYYMYRMYIRSHADLPLKWYQIVNTFRYETKATRPLIRVREITSFKEGHSCHATREDAERQVKEAEEIYSKFFDYLGVPYVISNRPSWDKFAGAVYTHAFDTLMPSGKSLQIGTVHYLGQNFSKPFDIKFEDIDGETKYVHQDSYGISERSIAALLGVHGDDNGLVLPPNVAPIQVIVVPIPFKDAPEDVFGESKKLEEEIRAGGIRVKGDYSDLTPGNKFYKYEGMGVPLRAELGPRDIRNNKVMLVRRDTGEKISVDRENIAETIKELLNTIQNDMREAAWARFNEAILKTTNLEQAKRHVRRLKGLATVHVCDDEECTMKLNEEHDLDVLGVPLNMEFKPEGTCPICGRDATRVVLVGKSY